MRGRKKQTYVVYDKKTTLPVLIDETAERCSDVLGISINSVHRIVHWCRRGIYNNSRWEIYRAEDV